MNIVHYFNLIIKIDFFSMKFKIIISFTFYKFFLKYLLNINVGFLKFKFKF